MALTGAPDEWEPLPGMHKLKCANCQKFFASRDSHTTRCPECKSGRTLPKQSEVDVVASTGRRVHPKH